MVKTSRPKTKARFERDRERCKLAIDALFRQVSQGKVPSSLPQTKEKKANIPEATTTILATTVPSANL